MEEKITLQTDTGESVDFYVLEETRINGMNYLLVTDSEEEEDGECYILKDVSKAYLVFNEVELISQAPILTFF